MRDAGRAASAAASGIRGGRRGGRRSGAHRFGGWAVAARPPVHAAATAHARSRSRRSNIPWPVRGRHGGPLHASGKLLRHSRSGGLAASDGSHRDCVWQQGLRSRDLARGRGSTPGIRGVGLRFVDHSIVSVFAIGGAFAGGLAVGLTAPREPVVVEVERIVTVPVEIEVERIVTVVVTPVPTVPEAIPTPSLAALQQEARTVCRTYRPCLRLSLRPAWRRFSRRPALSVARSSLPPVKE